MGNLKILPGLLACIVFLESTSTNSVNAQCQDRRGCEQYRFPLVCEGKHKEWYLKYCPKSCKACPADQLSNMYVENSTIILISSKSTIPEDRNVTDVNKVSVQPERTTGTTRILSSTGGAATCLDKAECSKYQLPLVCTRHPWFRENCQASCNTCPGDTSITTRTSTRKAPSHPQRTVVTTWIPSPATASGTCKDDNVCTRYKSFHYLCSGNDGRWYRQHCRLSCNVCITDQVSVTKDISISSTTSPLKARNVTVQVPDDVSQATSPVKAMNVSVQEHDVVTQATSPAKSKNVSEQVRDDVSQDFPESAFQLPSPHQNVIIAVVIIAVIILIVFIAGVVIFKKRRDKSSGKNPLQPTHKDMWSSDGQVVFTNVYEQTVLFSPDQRDQSSDQNHVIDINPPKQSTEETEVRDTCTVSVNKDGLVYSILDFKDFQPKDFVPPSPTERIEYATIDFGGTISCTKNTRD